MVRSETPHRREFQHDERFKELESLREENAELRELVIQLTKLVVKNVVDRK